MTVSQGYAIELNDMHGKPKSQKVYAQNDTIPISTVSYYYKTNDYLNGSFRLDNMATVIDQHGNIGAANIGTSFDYVGDMREHMTVTNSPTIQGNLDGIMIGIFPLPIPMIWPSEVHETTKFRSAVVTKVINRFGLLDHTTATDLTSVVTTNNLAYDAGTGDVLLTQTTTDYNDAIYSLNYPAYWYYDGMGPAFQNLGLSMNGVNFSGGTGTINNASAYFVPGDELALAGPSNVNIKVWVLSVSSGGIQVENRYGQAVPDAAYNLKVTRSGRRNQQQQPMAKLTSLSNPLNGFGSNIYEKVVQASAIEFSNGIKTFCDCFGQPNTDNIPQTTNPYVLGTLGMWRPSKSYLHLTGRTQSNYDNNTTLRDDGVFTSYTPFYSLSAGNWQMDKRNWTYTSQVTQFSPFGQELENMDALGRYSAATYGYKQSLATAVAANAMYTEIGSDNFEDYGFSSCFDNHFKFDNITPANLTTTEAHTGKYSIVVSGTPVTLTRLLSNPCFSPPSCNDSLAFDLYSTTTIKIFNGVPPYSFDWTIVNGAPSVSLINSADGILVTTNGHPWNIQVKVTDGQGCTDLKIFTGL